jgi:hypothetical protein
MNRQAPSNYMQLNARRPPRACARALHCELWQLLDTTFRSLQAAQPRGKRQFTVGNPVAPLDCFAQSILSGVEGLAMSTGKGTTA